MLIALALVMLSGPGFIAAQRPAPDDLDPYSVVSPNGKYKVWINPSLPDGEGSATYIFTANGRRLWKKTLPYTLQKACLTNSGRFAGYGYDYGVMSEGNLIVAIISPDGRPILEERTKRKFTGFLHSYPAPEVRELLFDPERDRLTMTFAEQWWSYDLKKPSNHTVLTPKSGDPLCNFIIRARQVPGTPLTLAMWHRFNGEKVGARFTVQDAAGKVLWSKTLAADYEPDPIRDPDERIAGRMRLGEAILRTDQNRRFELRFLKEDCRAIFEAKETARGWVIHEIARKPYREPAAEPKKEPIVPSRQLKKLETLEIPIAPAPEASVASILEFFLVGDNRFAVLESVDRITVLDRRGAIARRIQLPPLVEGDQNRCATQTGPNTLLVFTSTLGDNQGSVAHKVDLATGTVAKLSGYRSFPVLAVAGNGDGRFAAITSESSKYSSTERLHLFDEDGKELWSHGEAGFGGGDAEMLSPEDVAFDSKGQVLVLDNIRHSVQTFGADGNLVRMSDFDKLWGFEMGYPTQIATFDDGSYLIVDSGDRPLKRVAEDGKLLEQLTPQFKDGKALEPLDDPRIDADGTIWVTDGTSLFQLDAKAVAVETVGKAVPTAGLSRVSDIHIAADGRVTVYDDTTIEVHAFSPSGRRLARALPLPTDFSLRPTTYTDLAVTRSGEMYLTNATKGDVRFSSSGNRLEVVPDAENKGGDSLSKADPTWRWKNGRLLDVRGRVVTSLRRWPDYRWLSARHMALAPDGRIGVIGTPGARSYYNAPNTHIAIYDSGGKPRVMARLSQTFSDVDNLAFDGDMLYCLRKNEVIAIDRTGRLRWKAPAKGIASITASLGGLAMFDGKSKVIWYSTK